MRKLLCLLSVGLVSMLSASNTFAQIPDLFRLNKNASKIKSDTLVILPWFDEAASNVLCTFDDRDNETDVVITEPLREFSPVSMGVLGAPVVYDYWHILDSLELNPVKRPEYVGTAFDWIDDLNFSYQIYNHSRQNFIVNNPDLVKYNVRTLPEPPARYKAYVDPVTTMITLRERIQKSDKESVNDMLHLKKINWLRTFNASAQFSQTYVSPNWYQGGTRSLVVLVNIMYNVKLNQKLHPNLLFETNLSYKLGTNSSPEDSLRSYNISEDLFQANATFGYRAYKRWFYSATAQFKTQLLQSYNVNSNDLRSAFMSPGEANVGLGLTFDYTNKRNNFTFNASVAPLSWQLRTCFSSRIDRGNYDIKPGHHTVNKIGSSAEYQMLWKITYNIAYKSRMFLFTDYKLFQTDWEHTLDFNINRYLSTQIYCHLRYDCNTPKVKESWHKLQVKEIFSLGVSYRFSNT